MKRTNLLACWLTGLLVAASPVAEAQVKKEEVTRDTRH